MVLTKVAESTLGSFHYRAYRDAPDGASPFYHEIERFAMAVAGETEPEVSAPEAHLFMKILDALYDSAEAGRKIEIR